MCNVRLLPCEAELCVLLNDLWWAPASEMLADFQTRHRTKQADPAGKHTHPPAHTQRGAERDAMRHQECYKVTVTKVVFQLSRLFIYNEFRLIGTFFSINSMQNVYLNLTVRIYIEMINTCFLSSRTEIITCFLLKYLFNAAQKTEMHNEYRFAWT